MRPDPNILTRIAEFLGGRTPRKLTAAYITSDKDSRECPSAPHQFVRRSPQDLWECSRENAEISRSLWDYESLIVDLDIEYVNFDFPAEPFLNWERAFRMQRPVTATTETLLGRYGIKPLHLLTGRGHHFIWKIGPRSDSFRQVVRLGKVHDSLGSLYARPQAPNGKTVDPELGAAFSEFHHWFYGGEPEAPEDWPGTYDRVAVDDVPPCIRRFLLEPNDLLLKPAALQMLTRTLSSLGWHPRHVSGLVRSKYERDHNWGDQWNGYDPAQRADFYVRLFAGMTATNLDALVDFNCLSTAEKGYCPQPWCGFNLEDFKGKLIEARTA